MGRGQCECRVQSNKEFITKIDKKYLQTNKKNAGHPVEKWAKDWNRHFTEKEMANKHMKKCSTSLGIRKSQTKTTMLHHYIATERLKLKKQTVLGIREETEPSYTSSRYINWHDVF